MELFREYCYLSFKRLETGRYATSFPRSPVSSCGYPPADFDYVSFSFLAPLFYVKRIPQAEIRILGTVDSSLRLERSSLEIDESPIFNKSIIKSTKVNQSVHKSKGNVEESRRDVSLEEISADKGKKREKRKYNYRKIVEGNRGDQTIFGTRKKSMHSRETGRKDYFFSYFYNVTCFVGSYVLLLIEVVN